MPGFPRSFSTDDADEETFGDYDEFCPDNLPEPGPFLDGADLLTGDDHAEFHTLTRDIFEERGVYDATFGYNLARLNLDSRHPDAGWRYAVAPDAASADAASGGEEGGDSSSGIGNSSSGDGAVDNTSVLLAEFTPTTEFCPQSDSLTVGAFRAWNGLSDRHDYDRVLVAVSPMHYQSTEINEKLCELEQRLGEGDGNVDIGKESDGVSQRMEAVSDSDDDESALPF